MSPSAGVMLIHQVQPLIVAAIARGAVRFIGSEDAQELVQDTLATAAGMLDAAEAARRPFTPGTVAFYAIETAKTGRRANYKGRADALSPAAALDGRAQIVSLDEPIGADDDADGGELSLHDGIATRGEGPDEEAGRTLDWCAVSDTLNDRQQRVLRDAAFGIDGCQTADALRVSGPRVTQLRRQVAGRVSSMWDTDPFALVACEPDWRRHVAVARERRACRAERLARSC